MRALSSDLFWQDLRATVRERRTWLCGVLFVITVLATPGLLAKPPEHVLAAVKEWFESSDPFSLFLYVWTDAAMNKLVAITAVVLGSTLLLRERDTRTLSLLWAKPISPSVYFVLRLSSALGAMTILYVGAHVLGALTFPFRVPGFLFGPYFTSMALHLLSAWVCVSLTALVAMWIPRRTASTIVGLLLILLLMGGAFAGFYNPAWRSAAAWNPLTLGIQGVGQPPLASLLAPALGLLAWLFITGALGALSARRIAS